MTSEIRKSSHNLNIRLSRQVRRSQTDESRILLALPDEVPESTWVDILNTEELELMILSVKEDIIGLAMDVCYGRYMARQKLAFTAHCAAEAWLQIIDWHFFRHDPGEEPSAYPPAAIPNRKESWIADEIPDPSPKDTWCKHDLEVVEEQEESCNCSSSLTVEGIQNRVDDEVVVLKGSCSWDSNMAESSPCECSEKTRDIGPASSTSCSSDFPGTTKMDSSPPVPMSSECGESSRGRRISKPRKPKNIFSQSTSGRSNQTLPPLKKSSKTRSR